MSSRHSRTYRQGQRATNNWEWLPTPLRKLFSLPTAINRAPDLTAVEWRLSSMARRLGLELDTAYRLMDAGPLPPYYRYRHFSIPKTDGSPRQVVEPGPLLKEVQRKMVRFYLKSGEVHFAALGFRRKKSIADHAWLHAGAALIITADIQDFFPATSRQRVKGWWHQQGYKTLETRLLTSLTTYRGGLPQGAPTSPILSNLVNFELDATLLKHTKHAGGLYSRYADDMVFSWRDGRQPPSSFENTIRATLREVGYTLHPQKGWNVWLRRDEPTITGLVLTRDGSVAIPSTMKSLMYALASSNDPADQACLVGYQSYQHMIQR